MLTFYMYSVTLHYMAYIPDYNIKIEPSLVGLSNPVDEEMYPYTCKIPVGYFRETMDWVEANCGKYGKGDWEFGPLKYRFKHEYDAVAFKLRFGYV